MPEYDFRTISVDDFGRSCVVAVNDVADGAGRYGANLAEGDSVLLSDGSTWEVDEVGNSISTGGAGASNRVTVELSRRI